MRARKISLLMSVLCVGQLIVSTSQARTLYAGAGEATSPGSRSRFALLDTGVFVNDATSSNPFIYSVPTPMDTGGTKFFGARGSATGLSCVVRQRPTTVADVPLPITSPGSPLNAVPVSVVAGNSVWVVCTFTSTNARLLMIDYQP